MSGGPRWGVGIIAGGVVGGGADGSGGHGDDDDDSKWSAVDGRDGATTMM